MRTMYVKSEGDLEEMSQVLKERYPDGRIVNTPEGFNLFRNGKITARVKIGKKA